MHVECSRGADFDNIKAQNADQFFRITGLEKQVSGIRTDLIGISGANGLRGEFREFRKTSGQQMERISEKLEEMDKKRESAKRWHWEQVLAAGSLLVAAAAVYFRG